MKDLFSAQAELYAKYRPVYPPRLYEFVLSHLRQQRIAWDCATGNGQVARALVAHFKKVHASDISENQIRHAVRAHSISYSICAAERSPFRENSFDLITIAQAYHWFDTPAFCLEAKRVAKHDAVIAVWGYDLGTVSPRIDTIIHQWNFGTLAPFWESERRHVYSHYDKLSFDFERVASREFQIVVNWKCEDLIGHLRTWSALQKMKAQVGEDAFLEVVDQIRKTWGSDQKKRCIFPVFLKVGRVKK